MSLCFADCFFTTDFISTQPSSSRAHDCLIPAHGSPVSVHSYPNLALGIPAKCCSISRLHMSLEESYHQSSRSPFVIHPNMVPKAHSSNYFSLRVIVQPLTAKIGFRAAKGDYRKRFSYITNCWWWTWWKRISY